MLKGWECCNFRGRGGWEVHRCGTVPTVLHTHGRTTTDTVVCSTGTVGCGRGGGGGRKGGCRSLGLPGGLWRPCERKLCNAIQCTVILCYTKPCTIIQYNKIQFNEIQCVENKQMFNFIKKFESTLLLDFFFISYFR